MPYTKDNLFRYWILLNCNGNPVFEGMMGIQGTMARLPFLCPVALKLFGISRLTTSLIPLQSQRVVLISQDDDWGSNLECQPVW